MSRMCGRFDFHGDDVDVAAAFGVHLPAELAGAPVYNIAPSMPARVLHLGADGVRVGWMVFGWRRERPRPRLTINARSETVQDRGMFRGAFERRRCVVLANGFFEWDKATKPRQPWYFSPLQGTLCGFAGVWETALASPRSREADGALVGQFVVLTTRANALVAPLHDRMPVMLRPNQALAYVAGALGDATGLLNGYPAEHMRACKVSPSVNDARFDDARCIVEL